MNTVDAVRIATFRAIAREIPNYHHRLGVVERLDAIERNSAGANATVRLDRLEKHLTVLGYFDKDA